MTLEELKAALDAAKAKSLAAPDDKVLQVAAAEAEKAYNDAKAADDQDPPSDELDEKKLDDKTQAYIKKLRDEAAGHRVKAKDLASKLKTSDEQKKAILKAAGIEDDSEAPEEKLKTLSAQNQQLAFRSAILESAVQHGIAGDDIEYYEFLVTKATSELKDGDELTDEALGDIVKKVKKAGKGAANSGLGGGKGGSGGTPPPNDSSQGQVTLDQFVRMSISEKSALYEKNKDLYTSLYNEAKAKKKLV